MTITEFLTARLDEDEAVAKDAMHPTALYDSAAEETFERAANEGAPLRGLRHFSRWRPDRVLAEVEAKRRIVEMTPVVHGLHDPVADAQHMIMLGHLASAYADHPDHDEAWRV